jgi:hypothetical protein
MQVLTAISSQRSSGSQSSFDSDAVNKRFNHDNIREKRHALSTNENTKIPLSGKLLAAISFIMFVMTLTSAIEHFRPATSTQRSAPYSLSPDALQELHSFAPSNINVPVTCSAFLATTNLREFGLFNQTHDQRLSAGLHIYAFVCAIAVTITYFLRRRHYHRDLSFQTLKDCAFVNVVVLASCAIATAMYVALSLWKKGRWIEMRFTDEERSGGCTFAWIAMAKEFGYWDISEGLWRRIGLAILGV